MSLGFFCLENQYAHHKWSNKHTIPQYRRNFSPIHTLLLLRISNKETQSFFSIRLNSNFTENLNVEKYILFFILAFVAEIIGTVSGFGSSILFVPIASWFMDFKSVLAVTAVFHVFSNLSKILLFRKGVDRQIALKLGIPAVIFVLLGAILTNYIPVKEIELLMNILLVSLSIFLVWKSNKKLEQTDRNLVLGGTISGFLAGLIGTGGAIRGITLAAFRLKKNAFIATSAIIDLAVDGGRMIVYLASGYLQASSLIYIPFLIGISWAGSWVGKQILGHISEHIFRILVLVIILGISITQVVMYLNK